MVTARRPFEGKKTFEGPDLLAVQLDRSRIVPDDPGEDTPAMVTYTDPEGNRYGASWNCALDAGILHGWGSNHGDHYLTDAQIRWLEGIEDAVNEFLDAKETPADAK